VRKPGLRAHHDHVARAREALAANRVAIALEQARSAIVRCGDCPEGHVVAGRAFGAEGRHGDALVAFQRGLELSARALEDGDDAIAAATSAINVGRAELGCAILERLLARAEPPARKAKALVMLADALQARGPSKLQEAIPAYREAMQHEAARKPAWLGLALALHRSGQAEEALALAQRAEPDAEPAAAGVWLPGPERSARLGLWLLAIGDHAAAERAWLAAADGDGPWSEHARATGRALHARPNLRTGSP
jgi:tetratricopeptide (TPR) repeat protein